MFAVLSITMAVILLAEQAKQPPKPPFMLVALEKDMIDGANAERARYGLPPMEIDQELVQSAREHASWMVRNRALQHTRLAVAENIAMGQRTVREVLADWMRSPGHRANILNRGHRRIGAAAFQTPSGTFYWCLQFRP
ncbi:MAG: CAP domain-containing protein [Thermoguttaceae bacterium]